MMMELANADVAFVINEWYILICKDAFSHIVEFYC